MTTVDPAAADYATPPLAARHPKAMHSGITITRYYALHVISALLPLGAGVAFFGWRALGAVVVVVVSAWAGLGVWRRVGSRGAQVSRSHGLYLALLLGLALPAHLFSAEHWPVLPAAGLTLALLVWLLGGPGSGRVQPVVLTFLLLFGLYRPELVPHAVLHPDRLVLGDLRDVGPAVPVEPVKGAWGDAPPSPYDAVRREPAFQRLIFYTTGLQAPDRASLSLEAFLRDALPPLEDLLVGGHPGAIGSASAFVVIVGGLLLLYHGLIDYRIPLLIFASAFAALLVLPIPVVITQTARDWQWMAFSDRGVGWPLAITFANYELFAASLPLVAFFLATDPAVRPMSSRGRVVYGVVVGVMAAVFQLYVDTLGGPFLAALVGSLVTPALDRWLGPRALV